ncbi:MAG TPA: membrane protein insertase YidC [Desulfuromonadales bacterium]|nr:membrane protein insertase YidC [Desulfuromonadales bacterium]
MENKNVVVALILMLAVWLGYSFLFPPQQPAPTSPPSSAQTEPAPVLPAPSINIATGVNQESFSVASTEQAEARDLIIETEKYRAVFSSVGARLKVFELKEYRVSPKPDSPLVSIVTSSQDRFATLRTTGSEGFALSADARYTVSVAEGTLHLAAGESRQVVFRSVSPGGLQIEKIFTFRGDQYDFDYRLQVTNASSLPVSGNLSLSLVHQWDDSQEGGQLEFVGPATLAADKLHTDQVDDLVKEPRSYGQDVVWSAFEDKYFLKAAIPLEGAVQKVLVQKDADIVENVFVAPTRTLHTGETFSLDYLLYFGPKDLDILKVVDHQLARAVDFGFFAPIARPLLYVLKFFYSFIGNYGVAIILLTAIIKALFWPLTQKSYSSMKAMQKLQPEMLRIKEKYKNDRERLNRETMELYKTNRVNPLGGCLPMLVQIPVFFALYKVLLDAIELRHAPFALWLTDLSAKDPYYITPIVMGATMFIQQKMTPTNMDPMQAKMFMIMPIVFTFLFLNFPSGLVIYWLVNNVLTIVQQFFINRKA